MTRGHMKRLWTWWQTAKSTAFGIWMQVFLPWRKGQHLYFQAVTAPCCSPAPRALSLFAPHSCQPFLSHPLPQAPVPTPLSKPLSCAAHPAPRSAPYCWRLQQASSGANSKLSLHSHSTLKPLLVAKPTCSVPVRGVKYESQKIKMLPSPSLHH